MATASPACLYAGSEHGSDDDDTTVPSDSGEPTVSEGELSDEGSANGGWGLERWASEQVEEDIRLSEQRWEEIVRDSALPDGSSADSAHDARVDGDVVARMPCEYDGDSEGSDPGSSSGSQVAAGACRKRTTRRQGHRPKLFVGERYIQSACVARPVGKKDIAMQPEAMKAMQKEIDRLRKKKGVG